MPCLIVRSHENSPKIQPCSSRWMVNVAGQSFGVRNDASHDDAYAPVDRRS